MTSPGASTITFAIEGPISREDLPGQLCGQTNALISGLYGPSIAPADPHISAEKVAALDASLPGWRGRKRGGKSGSKKGGGKKKR